MPFHCHSKWPSQDGGFGANVLLINKKAWGKCFANTETKADGKFLHCALQIGSYPGGIPHERQSKNCVAKT